MNKFKSCSQVKMMVAQTWEGEGDGEKRINSKYSLRLGCVSAQTRREVLGVGLGFWPGGKGPQQGAKGPLPCSTTDASPPCNQLIAQGSVPRSGPTRVTKTEGISQDAGLSVLVNPGPVSLLWAVEVQRQVQVAWKV